MPRKSPFNNVMTPASIATSVPVSMTMPMLAWASADASFKGPLAFHFDNWRNGLFPYGDVSSAKIQIRELNESEILLQ